jgi:hypothetical protein
MSVSAVRVDIVGGTLPVKRFSKRSLRHNVSVRTSASTGRLPAARGVQQGQPGKRGDALQDRASEAVLGQEPITIGFFKHAVARNEPLTHN